MKTFLIPVLYVLFLAPTLYVLGGALQLVLTLGKPDTFYPSYGETVGEVLLAYIVLSVIIFWLCVGTVLTVLIFRKKIPLRWMWTLSAISSFVIFPLAIVFLLGAGDV